MIPLGRRARARVCVAVSIFALVPGAMGKGRPVVASRSECPTVASGLASAAPGEMPWAKILDCNFGPAVGDVPIVALGESVHGSDAYLDLEVAAIEYLVERRGFRLLALENPVIRTEGLDQWLGRCTGDQPPLELLVTPYRQHRELLRWLCAFNRNHLQNPVHIVGFDIWDRPWDHQRRMEKIAERVAPALAEQLAITRRSCPFHGANSWPSAGVQGGAPGEAPRVCFAALDEVADVARYRLRSRDRSPNPGVADLLISAVTMRAWQIRNSKTLFPAGAEESSSRDLTLLRARDEAQGENLFSLWSKYRHAKMIVVGQSSHCAKMLKPVRWLGMPEGDYRSAVSLLQESAGENRVRSFAITGYRISGSTGPVKPPRSEASLEKTLHHAGVNFGYLDPRGSLGRSRTGWTIADQGSRNSGGELSTRLEAQFDGYFFIGVSSPAVALPMRYDRWRW
jgi:erythromycin esterase